MVSYPVQALRFKLSMGPDKVLGVFRLVTLIGSILVSLGSGTNYVGDFNV